MGPNKMRFAKLEAGSLDDLLLLVAAWVTENPTASLVSAPQFIPVFTNRGSGADYRYVAMISYYS